MNDCRVKVMNVLSGGVSVGIIWEAIRNVNGV